VLTIFLSVAFGKITVGFCAKKEERIIRFFKKNASNLYQKKS